MIKLIYVAGPYRSKPGLSTPFNIVKAREAALDLVRLGYFPVTPHLNSANFELDLPQTPADFWLQGTLELMKRCDAVYVLPSWQISEGTKQEIEVARDLSIPVYFDFDNLPDPRDLPFTQS